MIKLIAAVDLNWGLGYNNQLLFRIEEDMKRFRKLTEGHIVVMGRRTYESLGKPLRKRVNVVVTRNKEYKPSDSSVFVEHNINKVLKYYLGTGEQDKDLWVIGGADIYEAFIECADEIWITHVNAAAENVDTWFPFEGLDEFKAVEVLMDWDEENCCSYSFVKYERIY
ncbi:dihydrofolate reductase [Solibacillus sp. FSL H8-0523]|uniref:dihydrofolate reductase n=1 Tax=Solibacillus sp. FSL H8-0523 TaxID=2954511 RepID=UPI003101A9A8